MSNPNQVSYKQDMPPSGGYKKIEFTRAPRWNFRPGFLLAGLAIFIPISIWDHRRRTSRNIKHMTEDDEGRIALEPLLEAESDRLQLWQMRRNRDDENELMKDVPGWVTGTWFGEPVYKTNPKYDVWITPSFVEFYPHCRRRDLDKQQFFKKKLI